MKKYYVLVVLFCPLLLLAQHPANDANWKNVLDEEFDGNRSWNDSRIDNTGTLRAYFSECGVTHGATEHQVYTRENTQFNNGTMVLKAEYAPGTNNYWNVNWIKERNTYNYKSGAIEFVEKYKYGYFEIRCKLPKPSFGNFPAFWLWSNEGGRYNEIDVFEQTVWNDYRKQGVSGTYYDGKGQEHKMFRDTLECDDTYYSSSYHTFAINWSPGKIVWYIDGVQKGVSDNSEYVPRDPMLLKANYAIDNWISNTQNKNFPMGMVIDYIRVYQLKCEHNKAVTLTTNSQVNGYSPSVKKCIKVSGNPIKVNKNLHLMATDYVEINGDFEVPLGVEFCAETVGCTCP
ncbi:MAG: glycoside hydrolase family 16 protein [Salinivirgaceae bacterium]|nr:glycoside hydrolase family 16 protein [Salinivirgaceae bacterium]